MLTPSVKTDPIKTADVIPIIEEPRTIAIEIAPSIITGMKNWWIASECRINSSDRNRSINRAVAAVIGSVSAKILRTGTKISSLRVSVFILGANKTISTDRKTPPPTEEMNAIVKTSSCFDLTESYSGIYRRRALSAPIFDTACVILVSCFE
jgi:hypothetical protein